MSLPATSKPIENTSPTPATPRHARWIQLAAAQPVTSNPLSVPYEVFLGEARAAAVFVRKYWTPTEGRPGLRRLQRRLPRAIVEEIYELLGAVSYTHAELTLAVAPDAVDPGVRARELIAELASAMDYTLDDGVDDDDDRRLAMVRAFHAKHLHATRVVTLAQDLLNHALLADRLRARLADDDEGFDTALIDEALDLAHTLGSGDDDDGASEASNDNDPATPKRALRNGLLQLLAERVARVRKAARRVFADHPEIVREVTSAHERARRARARARSAEGDAPPRDP